jgi:outer membrane protein insertion porin family/translocation and assembly module TamA
MSRPARAGWLLVHPRGILLLFLLLASPFTLSAQDDDGIVVGRLTFIGIESISESRLRAVLATRQGSRLPWGPRHYFDRGRFEADLKRIAAFYADRGYPDARIAGFDVDLDAERNRVDVTVTVDEGEPVIVAAVLFSGFHVIPDARVARLSEQAALDVGRPRDRQLVLATLEMAVNELREHGYPYARVSTDEAAVAGDRSVRVVFVAEPGPIAHFDAVEIVGNETVSRRVIERQLTYRPGDLYRRSAVQISQRRLYGMALFEFVNIEAIDPDLQSPQVRTRVTVAEGDHQRFNIGVGYGTEEKARVDGEYQHVNFFGGARSAGVHGRWSSLDRGVRFDFLQPYFFTHRLSFGVEGQQWYTDTPAYRSVITGGKVTVMRRTGTTLAAASFVGEYTSSAISADALNDLTLRDELIALGLDPTSGRQEGALNAVAVDLQRSTADNILNARRGYQLALHLEKAGGILPGTFGYFMASADGRHYLPVSESVVLASRLQLGSIDAEADEPANVPFSKKYFLGGATSVRGWGRYEISPLSGSGLPIGGNSLFAASVELRAPLRGRFGGVLFLDGGNVWEDGWTLKLDDLLYATGAGLRYDTPVGPVRLDFGYQLNPETGLVVDGEPRDRRWRLHFSIGQAF